MSDCNVCIDWSDCIDDPWSEFEMHDAFAADHGVKCYECDAAIPAGEVHERIVAIPSDRDGPEIYDTCAPCRDIRNGLTCNGAVIVGYLWEEIHECVFPEMTMACVRKVQSPEGREKLLAAWRRCKGL